ncbi:MAG: hypothetical protein U0235_10035 [Polyangiaceae bacterium]
MARITATEMVGVPLTTAEIERIMSALADGHLGPPDSPENVALAKKLKVLLQVAAATEKRRQSAPR